MTHKTEYQISNKRDIAEKIIVIIIAIAIIKDKSIKKNIKN